MDKQNYASRLCGARTQRQRVALTADWILRNFDGFYSEFLNVPNLAKCAFETQDHARSIWLSRRRISMYSEAIHEMGPFIKAVLPQFAVRQSWWDEIERMYLDSIEGRYEADLAFAFMLSVRRMVYRGEWRPVDYSYGRAGAMVSEKPAEISRAFGAMPRLNARIVARILELPGLSIDYEDIEEDAERIVARANQEFGLDGEGGAGIQQLEVIEGGFYRNRGAYIVGRAQLGDGSIRPLIIALLNRDSGIYVDALITTERDAHNLFSSTLANFHVTSVYYHELNTFLHSIMPHRALGLHYSTVGYNHMGKVAVINEIKEELACHDALFDISVGFRGTVAIGFAGPTSDYNLKVIRNHPTAGYKWGKFEGIEKVMEKYDRVHEINRTGSMLDNIIYYNIELEEDLFAPELLDELLNEASETVSLQNRSVVFKYLIVQRRLTPLLVFLENAEPADAATAIVNLGDCIKNNAAANIFNKDLDARNYGVSHFLKVYLFDYDAVEPFEVVKVRTNLNRIEGEEDVPDWYFEEGVVFLPEEVEAGLRLTDRDLRRLFREHHGDLLTVDYWEQIQAALADGRVPQVKTYPDECRLLAD
jgi:isocitrate dehydrogenase kinase/phosphatase